MAKKKELNLDSDFDLDGNLDDFDFDLPDPTVPDDRKPSIKIREGALQGAKDTVRDPKFIKQALKNIFPSGYGQAIDETDRLAQTLKSLYDESVKDVRPVLKQAKQAAVRLIPSDSKKVPEKLRKILEKWRNEEKTEFVKAQDAREAMLSGQLNDIFTAQAEVAAQDKAQADAQRNVSEGVAMIRHRSVLETLQAIAQASQAQASYTTKVGLNYQRKSLELQYRQLFATQDALAYAKEDAQKRDNILLAIAKNTALPEFVKIKDSESRKQASKNKFHDAIAGGLYGGRNRMVAQMLSQLQKRIGSAVKDTAGGLRDGLSDLSAAGELSEGMGADPYVMGGNIGGAMATDFGGGMLGRLLGRKLKNSKMYKGSKLEKGNALLEAFFESLPNRLNEFRQDGKYMWGSSLKDRALGFAQQFVPNMGLDKKADVGRGADMMAPYQYTRRTDRSINEVIPGLLARIYRELQVTRTGNTKLGLTVYDHDKNRFTSEAKASADVLKQAAPPSAVKFTQQRINALLQRVDPAGKLSPEARAALKQRLLFNSADNNLASHERLADPKAYKGVSTAAAQEAAAHMHGFMSGLDPHSRGVFESQHNRLAQDVADPRAQLQTQIDLGNVSMLRRLGLLNVKTGEINLSKVLNLYLDEQNGQTGSSGPSFPSIGGGPTGPAPNSFVGPMPNAAWYARNATQGIGDRLRALGSQASLRGRDAWHDLYVNGEQTPRLQAVLLQAGAYRQALSGKIVQTYDDLSEDIVDSAGNVVVRASEIARLTYYDVQAKAMASFTVLSTKAADASQKALGALSGLGKMFRGKSAGLMAAMRGSSEALDPNEPVDIYVEGENEPRITAAEMRAGTCVDADTEQPVMRPADITGEVRNERGQVVIRREDGPRLRFFNWRVAKYSPLWFAGKLAKNLWHFQTQVAPGMAWRNLGRLWKVYKGVGTGVFKVGKFVLGIRHDNQPQDVYTRGALYPALLGKLMKEGRYYSVNSNRPIRWPRDIDGAVKDINGQILITDEEYRDGLFNVDGRKVSSGIISKLIKATIALPFKIAGSMVRGAGKAVSMATKGVFQGVSAVGRGGLNMLGSTLRGVGRGLGHAIGIRYEGGSDEERKLLAEQRRQAAGSMPQDDVERKNHNATVSKLEQKSMRGSIRDIMRRTGMSRAEVLQMQALRDQDEIAANAHEEREERKRHRVRQNSDEDKRSRRHGPEGHGPTTPAQAARNAAAGGGSLASVFGIDKLMDLLGMGKDAASLLGKGAKGAAGLAGKIGKSGLLARAGGMLRGLLGLGGLAAGAEGAAAAGTALAGGAAAAEGAAVAGTAAAAGGGAGLLATIGGGLLAFVSSPVVIGAAAAGLAGYGIYRAVKYFRRGHLSTLGQLRLVQYGFKADDTGHAKGIVDLEGIVSDILTTTPAGAPLIDDKKLDMRKAMSCFDLNPMDQRSRDTFFFWYQKRFKPVFLTHIAAIRGLTGKTDLSDAEDLKAEQKKRFIDAVAFASGPYDVTTLPMVPQTLQATTAQDVRQAVQAALDELSGVKPSTAAKVATAAVAAATGATSAEAKPAPPGTTTLAMPPIAVAAKGTAATVTSVVGVNALSDGKPVAALDAVRFKAYGLPKLIPHYVQAVRVLERMVEPDVAFNGQGSASWQGDMDELAGRAGVLFGINPLQPQTGLSWKVWFRDRFLPVFMIYMTAYRARTGKIEPSKSTAEIRPQDQFEIAKLMVGAKGIWQVAASPWTTLALATDSAIANDNLTFLEDAANKQVLDEQKKTTTAPTPNKPASTVAQVARQAATNANGTATSIDRMVPAPDAEALPPPSSAAPDLGNSAGGGTGSLTLASGPLYDGRNVNSFLRLARGVKLEGLNPQFKTQLMGMIEEYGSLTGKAVTIRDGFRTFEDQEAMQRKYGARAAAPGQSLHEYGLAVDIDQRTLDEMDKLGLTRKYGFLRPVGQEPWHLEAIGTQANIEQYKKDAQAASEAIQAGAGHGGGGWGTMRSAKAYSRNADFSSTIAQASVGETSPAQAAQQIAQSPLGNFTPRGADDSAIKAVIPIKGGRTADANTAAARAANVANGEGAFTRAGRTRIASNDAEFTPPSGTGAPVKNVPSDPTIKVPDPKGPGLEGTRDTIVGAANLVGVDPALMLQAAAVESDFKPYAQAPTSSAAGLFQQTTDNFNDNVKKYGSKYGYAVGQVAPTDAKASALMAAHYYKDNLDLLQKQLGRPATATDMYALHFFGRSGGIRFLNALQRYPDAPAQQLFPAQARANAAIFLDGNRPRTVSEVYDLFNRKLSAKSQEYGLAAPDTSAAPTAVASALPPSQPSFIPAAAVRVAQAPTSVGASDGPITPTRSAPTTAPVLRSQGILGLPSGRTTTAQPQPGAIDGTLMKTTEGLLTKQVDLTGQLLNVVSGMAQAIQAKATDASAAAASPAAGAAPANTTYTPPEAPVSMRKARFGT